MPHLFIFLFFIVFSSASIAGVKCPGCSTYSLNNNSLKLDKLDNADLAEMTAEQVELVFGMPDIKQSIAKEKDAFVYIDNEVQRTPRLSLVFSSKTKKLLSANWFVSEKDPENSFAEVQKRYPKSSIDIENSSFAKEGIYGISLNKYRSTNAPLRVFVEEKSTKVSALSWVLNSESENLKRKPTSH